MKKISELLGEIPLEIKQPDPQEERRKLAYEISAYFKEPVYLWFRYFKESGVFTSFIRLYFKECKQAMKPKKVQAMYLMKKLFPQGKNKM